MVPMKHSSIFRSRWFALVWAAGIIWFALDVAGGGETDENGVATVTDATGAPVSDDQVKQLAKVVEGL